MYRLAISVVVLTGGAAGDRQETVISPLAPLQGLLSLLQTFPQSGQLANTDNVDRTQCSIR